MTKFVSKFQPSSTNGLEMAAIWSCAGKNVTKPTTTICPDPPTLCPVGGPPTSRNGHPKGELLSTGFFSNLLNKVSFQWFSSLFGVLELSVFYFHNIQPSPILGLTSPYHSTPCGWATPEMAISGVAIFYPFGHPMPYAYALPRQKC